MLITGRPGPSGRASLSRACRGPWVPVRAATGEGGRENGATPWREPRRVASPARRARGPSSREPRSCKPQGALVRVEVRLASSLLTFAIDYQRAYNPDDRIESRSSRNERRPRGSSLSETSSSLCIMKRRHNVQTSARQVTTARKRGFFLNLPAHQPQSVVELARTYCYTTTCQRHDDNLEVRQALARVERNEDSQPG